MKVLEYTEDRILTEGAGIPSIELSEIIILVGVGFFFFWNYCWGVVDASVSNINKLTDSPMSTLVELCLFSVIGILSAPNRYLSMSSQERSYSPPKLIQNSFFFSLCKFIYHMDSLR